MTSKSRFRSLARDVESVRRDCGMTNLAQAAALIEQTLESARMSAVSSVLKATAALSEQIADEAQQSRERDEQIIAMLADIRARLDADSPPAPSPAPPVEIPEATLSGYSVGTAGDWVAQATPWGMDGQPASSFVRAGIGDGPVGRAAWSVVDRSGLPQVKAFPHIRTGAKPGYSRAGSALPMRVQGAGGRYAVDVLRSDVSGRGHLAYNLWVMDTDRVINGWNNAAPHITAEILVQHSRWGDYSNPHGRYPGGRNPAGRIAQGVSFGGAVVSVYRESSGAGGSIPLYLVIPHDGHTIKTLDLAEIDALLREQLGQSDWLADLEIGPEIVEGDGDMAWGVTVA